MKREWLVGSWMPLADSVVVVAAAASVARAD